MFLKFPRLLFVAYRAGVAAVILAGSLLVGCDDRTAYEKLVDRELESGAVHDSLFLGYELGMAKQSFYDHSWDLNRQGLVMQGPRNLTVQYELDDELPYEAKMFYYPDFHDEKVFQMRVTFLYDGWAPWNKEVSADSLQRHVVDLLEEWYGAGFIELGRTRDTFGERIEYVKVDGNRRIVVSKLSDSEVGAVFTDLNVERAIEMEQKDAS